MINSAKVIKEVLLQKFSDENMLLKSEDVKRNLQQNMGKALSSFSDVRFNTFINPIIR